METFGWGNKKYRTHVDAATSGGFTLVEVIIALILAAIVAILVAPRSPGTTPSLAAQAEQVESDLRYVQSRAMSLSQRHRMCLSLAGYTFATTNCATPMAHPVTGNTTPIGFGGVTFSWSANLTNNYIAFDSGGAPYSTDPGTALTANAVITLTSNQGGTRTITISPETGKAASP